MSYHRPVRGTLHPIDAASLKSPGKIAEKGYLFHTKGSSRRAGCRWVARSPKGSGGGSMGRVLLPEVVPKEPSPPVMEKKRSMVRRKSSLDLAVPALPEVGVKSGRVSHLEAIVADTKRLNDMAKNLVHFDQADERRVVVSEERSLRLYITLDEKTEFESMKRNQETARHIVVTTQERVKRREILQLEEHAIHTILSTPPVSLLLICGDEASERRYHVRSERLGRTRVGGDFWKGLCRKMWDTQVVPGVTAVEGEWARGFMERFSEARGRLALVSGCNVERKRLFSRHGLFAAKEYGKVLLKEYAATLAFTLHEMHATLTVFDPSYHLPLVTYTTHEITNREGLSRRALYTTTLAAVSASYRDLLEATESHQRSQIYAASQSVLARIDDKCLSLQQTLLNWVFDSALEYRQSIYDLDEGCHVGAEDIRTEESEEFKELMRRC